MDTILGFFQSMSVSSDTQHTLFLLATGATVFLFALGVSFLVLATMDPVRRRLNALAVGSESHGEFAASLLRLLEPINRFLLPNKGSERGKMEQRLAYAGLRSANALPLFYAIKTGLALLFLLAVVTLSAWLPQWSVKKLVFFAMFAAYVGLMLPNYVLDHLVERRQKRLRDAFPGRA